MPYLISVSFILLAFIAIMEWLLPTLQRPDNLFSVTVAPDTKRHPEGRAMIARWRISVVATTIICALLMVLAIYFTGQAALLILTLMPVAIALSQTVIYTLFHHQALAFSLPSSGEERTAPLVPRRYAEYLAPWWEAVPLAIIGASTAAIAWLYPGLPAVYPIHWDLNGQANGFATKSIASAFLPIWIQLAIWLLLTGIGVLLVQARMASTSVRQVGRRTMIRVLFILKALILTQLGVVAVVTTKSAIQGTQPSGAVLGMTLGFVIVVFAVVLVAFVRAGQSGWRSDPSAARGDGMPDSAWIGGIIYFNPADSAWLVERRGGYGYTFNFARPQSWLALIGILLIPVVTILLGIKRH